MKTEKLVEQLELYSNAITGFMVAQSAAFAFTLGTNPVFSCEVTRYKILASGLLAHFIFSSAAASWALSALSKRIVALYSEGPEAPSSLALATVKAAALGKSALVWLFALIPMALLVGFGLLGEANQGRCAPHALLAPAHSAA